MSIPTPLFEIQTYGPTRALGLAIHATPGVSDFAGLWVNQLVPRRVEIIRPAKGIAFGFCRCLPNSSKGTFEYIAAYEATPDAPIPPGMVAVAIPDSRYAVFPVAAYSEFGQAWHAVPAAFAAHPELQPYCGPQGCQCSTHPSFELYPWDPDHKGNAFLYIALKPA